MHTVQPGSPPPSHFKSLTTQRVWSLFLTLDAIGDIQAVKCPGRISHLGPANLQSQLSGVLVVLILEDFAGDCARGLLWAIELFSSTKRLRDIWRQIRLNKKSPAAQTYQSAKKSALPRTTLAEVRCPHKRDWFCSTNNYVGRNSSRELKKGSFRKESFHWRNL